ncbi:MAG: trypsin-like peptidase domain-containing protein [Nitrospinae bacterium]|nr:trypsin-like peptidase domain-containing protein [Nitrospinota bacterium]
MKQNRIVAVVLFLLLCAATGGIAHAADRRTPVVLAVERVAPSVVNINTSYVETVNPFRDRFGGRSPFGDLYPPQRIERTSLGSGVIISRDGYILTNNHVVDGASSIRVTLSDNREFPAEVVGADPRSDIAVIRVEGAQKLPVAPLGRSSDLMIGETVIAIGNPFGLSHTVTTGILSAMNRDIKGDDGILLQDFLQVDAPINPGNSGGALLNINGELIGVTSAIYRSAEGIGFAIPIDRAMRIVTDLISHGRVIRGWAGFVADDLSARMRRDLGYDRTGGGLVTKVFDGGPGQRGGLAPGDVIEKIDGKPVKGGRDVSDRLLNLTGGDRLTLSVFRFGKRLTLTVTAAPVTGPVAERVVREWLGATLMKNDRARAKEFGLRTDKGMIIEDLDEAGGLAAVGALPGDVIRRINRTVTDTPDDLKRAALEAITFGGGVIYLQRGAVVYQLSYH